MINGTKTEAEYRKLPRDSSSSLKEFSLDRRKYYKKYVNLERVEEEDSKAATIGSLLDCLLLTPQLFDDKFYMSSIASVPTENMLKFCEALYKHSQNEELEFKAVLHAAYKDSGYKLSFEKVLERFTGSDAEIWFNEVKTVRKKNLTVITLNDITNAERIKTELQTNEFTAEIVNRESDSRYDVYKQLQIEDYEVDGLPLKSMLDFCTIDKKLKTIQVDDLKCTWSVEGFLNEYYLYRRSYIQAYLYKKAVEHRFKDLIEEGYTVLNPRFIVVDSINYYSPIIYTTSDKNMEEAYNGFTHEGKYYPGVRDIIKDLQFAKSKGVWNMSRKNYELKGIVPLKNP